MDSVLQEIRLEGARDFGRGVPPTALGDVVRLIEPAVRKSVRMAFEGRSSAGGRRPKWLEAAADVRLVDVALGKTDAMLRFEAPRFGDAAPSLFQQTELFPHGPEHFHTGFDMLAGVLSRVRKDDADSDRYDASLLTGIASFERGIKETFSRIDLLKTEGHSLQVLDRTTVDRAKTLRDRTPAPRPARLVATLDMLRVSTGALGLKLDDGAEIRGVVTDEDLSSVHPWLGRRVLVHGRAVYRPSGSLLRFEVAAIEDGVGASTLFTRVPEPIRSTLTAQQTSGVGPRASGGIAAMFGRWPGNESDEELLHALKDL
jgi:hypothetical protein